MYTHAGGQQAHSARTRPRLSVMVVDDDEHVREALRLGLQEQNDDVVCCSGAAQALECLRNDALPDLIVLDLVMPGMDGWQFRAQQKREPAWSVIPVIAMSGDHSAKAAAIDAVAYLSKPFEEQLLLSMVEQVATNLAQTRAFERTRELQRLVSLGLLIEGVAHELNNSLACLFGCLDRLQTILHSRSGELMRTSEQPLAAADALQALGQARQCTERIAALMRGASKLAFADPASPGPIDVRDVLESCIAALSSELPKHAELLRSYEEVPPVNAVQAYLDQAFYNLLSNVFTAVRESSEPRPVVEVATAVQGEQVVVTIRDNVFRSVAASTSMIDPLTTVTSGATRLNFELAISRELVHGLGGSVEVDGTSSRGSTFRVVLPASSQTGTDPFDPTGSRKRPAIMVVDDEPLLCELLVAMLEADYDVTSFTSPQLALSALLERDFDVVLCDVMMPELDGMQLYERAIRERPWLSERFIFITGGAFTPNTRRALDRTTRPVLRKPYAAQKLHEAIEGVLRSPR